MPRIISLLMTSIFLVNVTTASPKAKLSNLQNTSQNVDYCKDAAKKLLNNSESEWDCYMKTFGKEYGPEEKEMRKAIFKKNKDRVENHNKLFKEGKVSYSLNLNHLSDRTKEELQRMRGLQPSNSTDHRKLNKVERRSIRKHHLYFSNEKVPYLVDWRKRNWVTPIKDQGNCCACYAFSGIGALEAYHRRMTGHLVDLSEQNIIDCSWDVGGKGCCGGLHRTSFEYAKLKGVVSEEKYPYRMNDSHKCQWKKENVVTTIEGYYTVSSGDELSLQHAVARYGPVSVGIGKSEDFEMYSGGVFNPSYCGRMTHSLLVIGYGSHPKHGDFWICKNSFGESWGIKGYVLIARNKNNACNVATHVYLPV